MKKRLAFLIIGMYLLTVLMPYQVVWAIERIPLDVGGAQRLVPLTTGGQVSVNPEDVQRTSAAILRVDQLITQAQILIDEAPLGTTPGSYRIQDKEKLEAVWQQAKEDRVGLDSYEEALRIAKQLQQAIIAFKTARMIDVGQLGLAAYYYGHIEEDSSWNAALWFDMNQDGIINDEDLRLMVKKHDERK
ncbi:MAG: hypothetical protein ACRCW2_04365 [Cellulosilyticaceae bacterium]